MKMVIGGRAQGKCAAACKLYRIKSEDILDGASCEIQEVLSCKAVCNFHLLIRRVMEKEEKMGSETAESFAREILLKNPGVILITTEIGYGLVPVDAFERAWRDATGRICCTLAKQAESVVRVTAGLVQVLK